MSVDFQFLEFVLNLFNFKMKVVFQAAFFRGYDGDMLVLGGVPHIL